jgi:hypothetical protein
MCIKQGHSKNIVFFLVGNPSHTSLMSCRYSVVGLLDMTCEAVSTFAKIFFGVKGLVWVDNPADGG